MNRTDGLNVAAIHLGDWEAVGGETFKHPSLPLTREGTLFLKDLLGLTGLEVSLNALPPGKGMSFLHKHQENEELYVVIKGRGQFQVDGQTFDIGEGSVIRVSPDGERIWRNNGDEPLYFIVVQSKANSMITRITDDGMRVESEVHWPVSKV